MKELNKENIEAWLLDYIEGNLTPEQSVKLEFFLSENPEYACMMEEYEPVKLEPEPIKFSTKSALKKGLIHNDLFDERCIAYLEGLLTPQDKAAFEEETENDTSKQQLFNQYRKARLIPDYSIIYDNKSALKQSLLSRRLVSYLPYAAAASVLLVAGMFFLEHQNEKITVKNIASIQVPVHQASVEAPVQQPLQPSSKKDASSEKAEPQKINTKSSDENQTPVLKEDVMVQPDLAQNNDKNDYSDEELKNYKGISVLAPLSINKIRTGNELVAITSIELRSVKVKSADNALSSSDENSQNQFDRLMASASRNLPAKDKFSIFHIAQKLVHRINEATGSDMRLEKQENEEDNSETLAFDSKYFGFTKTTKK
jgi:hypothetical protein